MPRLPVRERRYVRSRVDPGEAGEAVRQYMPTDETWSCEYVGGALVIKLEGEWAGIDTGAVDAAVAAVPEATAAHIAARGVRSDIRLRAMLILMGQYQIPAKTELQVEADLEAVISGL